jgi:addiction module HigA family antidote
MGTAIMTKNLPPMHPGEVLREEFLVPLGLSAGALAKAIDVPRTRIERIVAEVVGITADTAVRLATYFGTSVELWLNLQNDHDIQVAKKELRAVLKKIVPRPAPVAANENPEPAEFLQRA